MDLKWDLGSPSIGNLKDQLDSGIAMVFTCFKGIAIVLIMG